MEFSPLRFLDFDASQMLADQVRLSQEEEARTFHDNLFENSHEINLNWDNHYLMTRVFEDIGYLLAVPKGWKRGSLQQLHSDWLNNISEFKRCYNVCVKTWIENTRLQRCGYNY